MSRHLLLLVAPLAAAAGAPDFHQNFISELELTVGEVRIVTPGPVRGVVCEPPGIVELASTNDGNGFRALAAGTATCGVTTADGVKRTVNIRVQKKDAPAQ